MMKKRFLCAFSVFALLVSMLAMPVSAAGTQLPPDPPLPDIIVSNGTIRMKVGERKNITTLLTYYNSEQEIYPIGSRYFLTSDPEKVSVDQDGNITALKTGTVKITLLYANNHAKNIEQTVRVRVVTGQTKEEPDFLFTIREEEIIDLGQLFYPGLDENQQARIDWTVDKAYAASVSSKGIVTGLGYGTCKVAGTYTDAGGNSFSREATVKVLGKHNIALKDMKLTLTPGQSVDIVKVLYPNNKAAMGLFSSRSSDVNVVDMDADHRIAAFREGTAKVTLVDSFKETEQRQVIDIVVTA